MILDGTASEPVRILSYTQHCDQVRNFDMEGDLIRAYSVLLFTILAPVNTILSILTILTAPTTPTEEQ